MNRRVRVTTGARLHFGPLAVGGVQGRTFGGVGLMIETPGWQVTVERSEREEVTAGESTGRVTNICERFRRNSPVPASPCRVTVTQQMPAHTGLGSGTQLALAVARGLATLAGEDNLDAVELARRTERGCRSAIGTHGFTAGGFLVDAGHPVAGGFGELACRLPMPPEWRFLLASPKHRSGLSGTAERRAFETLEPMPAAMNAELCRVIVMDWLPAVTAADFEGFCAALDAFGGLVGEYFSPVQGDVFANQHMSLLAKELRAGGVRGIAQSSWGPTIAVSCADLDAAEELDAALSNDRKWDDCEFRIVRPLNEGAHVVVND